MFVTQLLLLLWKNATIHRRNLSMTFTECLVPSVFAIILLILKMFSQNTFVEYTVYPKMPIMAPKFETMVGFVPNNEAVENVMGRFQSMTSVKPANKLKGFKTIDEAKSYFQLHAADMRYIIEFRDLDETKSALPPKVKVVIHPYRKTNQIWNTDLLHTREFILKPRFDKGDYEFLFVQSLVSKAVLDHWLRPDEKKSKNAVDFPLYFKRFPNPSYWDDDMYLTVKVQLTLFIVLGFMMSVFVDTKNIVQEKELKIKESMKLMGMNLAAFWMSWLITCFAFLLPSLTFYTMVLGLDMTGKGPILAHSDASVLFVFIISYGFALISFSFMVSCLVQKANDGAIAAGLLFLIEYVPYEVISQRYHTLSRSAKLSACFLFNVALGLGNFNIVRREARVEGVQWNNVNTPVGEDDFTVLDSIIMLLVDTLIHLLLTWYLDNVFPGEYGVPKSFFFFLKASYWCGSSGKDQNYHQDPVFELDPHLFEKEPENLKIGIEMLKLRKEFGNKVCVQGLCLKIYEGQITVLLGHNGAGKTTTMSMLTGFIPPSKGTAIINGYDIQKNIAGVHKSLGLCPQHDILFNDLTVKEHLWFFVKLKGYNSSDLSQEIDAMVKEVGLEDKSNSMIAEMSGGEKRSLSVGIALMGDSKVVFLDEPSSGMDPSTRRHTWDVLQKNRISRTMMLSTHYMDEADALGDRIAIMAEGQVQCCGSSMFLKKLYGAGYHLVIVKDPTCDVAKLTEVILEWIPNAIVENIVTMEVSYLLPDTDCAKFPDLFRFLKENKKTLKIFSFGTTATTMEEVFLKSGEVAERASGVSQSVSFDRVSKTSSLTVRTNADESDFLEFNSGFKRIQGIPLIMSQFKALFKKRFIVTQKHWMMTILSYTLPSFLVLLYVIIDSSVISTIGQPQPELTFDIDKYGSTIVPYSYDSSTKKLGESYKKQFSQDHHLVYLKQQSQLDEYLSNEIEEVGRVDYRKKFIVGAAFERGTGNSSFSATVLYNGEPFHALFTSMAVLMNAIAQHLLDDSYQLKVGIFPLPKEGESELQYTIAESHRSGFLIGLFLGIGVCMYSSLVVHYLLKEKQSGVKHMHAIFGVTWTMYWLPTLMWDALSFVVPTIFLIIIFGYFELRAFLDGSNWIIVIVVISLFVWAVLPCTYAFHFIFGTPSSGLAGVLIFNLFAVILSDIMVFEFSKPNSENKKLGKLFSWIFTVLFPTFNLSQCFNFILKNYEAQTACQPLQKDCLKGIASLCCINQPALCYSLTPNSKCFEWSNSYLDFDQENGIGIYMVFMTIQGFFGCFAVFMIEFRFFQKLFFICSKRNVIEDFGALKPVNPVDESDVLQERERILSKSVTELSQTDSLLLVNLHKRYNIVNAVDHICVGVPEKECFGLLGQSGAGKTTTFRMLTGETGVTSGNAYLKGFGVRTDLKTVQSNIGYCPQVDAHIPELTGRETLIMYAQLRGIPYDKVHHIVDSLIETVLLGPHAESACGTYSGGNKRKLSLAMALVGNPPFIFLDEPSTGMDPKARRQMWNVLSKIRASGRTLVLSSHSMEECDALCTRLAIMLRGCFMCLGSPQHLKNKYGQGYTLIIKMRTLPDGDIASTGPVVEKIQSVIPQTSVFDDHQGYIHLQISDTTVEVADVFSLMESCKLELNLEDYSVHETTLEQIFLTFTKLQKLDTEKVKEHSRWFLRAGFFDDNFCVKAAKSENTFPKE